MFSPITHPRLTLLLALTLGAISVLGFAPFYLYPIPIAALVGLFYLWQKSGSAKQSAWMGFVFGLGLFNTGIYWIYISLHDFGGMPFWMAAFSTFVLNAFLSLFLGAVGYCAGSLWRNKKAAAAIIVAPLLWAITDWIRSWIFTGFPWLTLGYSQIPNSPLAGFAPVLGVYGVSMVTALAASLIALWGHPAMRRNLVLGIAMLWIAGSLFKLIDWSKPVGAPISVALVQGNIAQDMK